MSTSAIIQCLRAQVAAFANRVGGAAELAPALLVEEGDAGAAVAVPHAWVVPLDIDAGETDSENPVQQRVDRTFGVVVCLDNTADARGLAAVKAMEALESDLFAALLGWPPAAGWAPLTLDGAQQLQMNRARLWWQYDFATFHVIQEA